MNLRKKISSKFRIILIKFLKNILFRLEVKPDMALASKSAHKNEPNIAGLKTEIAVETETPSPKIIKRYLPKDGREKLNIELHTARCCATHGCNYGDERNCIVILENRLPYFQCEKCL